MFCSIKNADSCDQQIKMLIAYAYFGNRAFAWTLLTEQLILARAFINHFLRTSKEEDKVSELLMVLFQRVHNVFQSLWYLYYADEDFLRARIRVGHALAMFGFQLHEHKKEDQRITASHVLRQFLTTPVEVPLAKEEQILNYYVHATATFFGKSPEEILPEQLCFFMDGGLVEGFYERLAGWRMLFFVLGSRIMEKYLKPWVEGEYSPLPLTLKALVSFNNAYLWGIYPLKQSTNILNGVYAESTFTFAWQKLFENCSHPPLKPVFLNLPASFSQEIAAQESFLVALVSYGEAGQRPEHFVDLKQKFPRVFSYRRWLYVLEKYPLPEDLRDWPWKSHLQS